jgi:alkylation response protein AidB-like acyl-CoA dehydrogenase
VAHQQAGYPHESAIRAGCRRPSARRRRWALRSHHQPIYDIFEGTTEIQQLVIARAISVMHIK